MAWTISQSLLQDLMSAAKRVYPYEFISMLSVGEKNAHHVTEFVVLPAEYGLVHSQLRSDLIPNDPLIVGTVHSHPSRSTRASNADKNVFARLGSFHLILGYPYSLSSFQAYSSFGNPISVKVV
ncbi:MAG: Mov34/MPN/PAD-1 family protein [Candidatus Diapherotrites archaeon]